MMTLPCDDDSGAVNSVPAVPEVKIKNAPPPPDEILKAYFAVHKALFEDNLKDALAHVEELDKRYGSSLASSNDLDTVRKKFENISKRLYKELLSSSENLKSPVYKFFCPMAFNNKGAFWLQDKDKLNNPYFGPAMPMCGELQETISAGK
jgi:hypothetical protein